MNNFQLYSPDGRTLQERQLELTPFAQPKTLDDAAHYLPDPGLCDAVNVALALGQPLLLMGEPGTGKTQLAANLAHQLGLDAPLIFNVKTTSSARDLFYRYDSLRHFHEAQFRKHEGAPLSAAPYIEYEALGLAVLLSRAPTFNSYLPGEWRLAKPRRSVVLIDEIDKAPRDLPNDVLNEIEKLAFTVKETGQSFSAAAEYRPIVVLTSNSEKNLPDAFLRRCIFYHIAFPEDRLLQILAKRLPQYAQSEIAAHAVAQFKEIRQMRLRKVPATAEFIAWVRVLEQLRLDVQNVTPTQAAALASSYSTLAKTKEDLDQLLDRYVKPLTS